MLYLHLRLAKLVPLPNRERAGPLLLPPGTEVSMTNVVPSQKIGVRNKIFNETPHVVVAAKQWYKLSKCIYH